MPARFIFPTEQAFRYDFMLTNYDGTPYAGKGDIEAYVSDEYGGTIVSGMQPVSCMEVGVDTGVYSAVFPADASKQFIVGRSGKTGYVCQTQGGEVLGADACVFRPTSPVASG